MLAFYSFSKPHPFRDTLNYLGANIFRNFEKSNTDYQIPKTAILQIFFCLIV